MLCSLAVVHATFRICGETCRFSDADSLLKIKREPNVMAAIAIAANWGTMSVKVLASLRCAEFKGCIEFTTPPRTACVPKFVKQNQSERAQPVPDSTKSLDFSARGFSQQIASCSSFTTVAGDRRHLSLSWNMKRGKNSVIVSLQTSAQRLHGTARCTQLSRPSRPCIGMETDAVSTLSTH